MLGERRSFARVLCPSTTIVFAARLPRPRLAPTRLPEDPGVVSGLSGGIRGVSRKGGTIRKPPTGGGHEAVRFLPRVRLAGLGCLDGPGFRPLDQSVCPCGQTAEPGPAGNVDSAHVGSSDIIAPAGGSSTHLHVTSIGSNFHPPRQADETNPRAGAAENEGQGAAKREAGTPSRTSASSDAAKQRHGRHGERTSYSTRQSQSGHVSGVDTAAAEGPLKSTTSSRAPRGLGLRSRPPGGAPSAAP